MPESKRRAIIIHGAMGSPEENWFSWLAGRLRDRGLEVLAPRFPTPAGQSLESWRETLLAAAGDLQPDDLLIGHSIGCAFLLRLLEEPHRPVRAAFLAAPFMRNLGNPKFDALNHTFIDGRPDWKVIRGNCAEFFTYGGDDDPYVPLGFSQEVSWRLGATMTVIPGGGHLNAAAGYLEFPELFDDLRRVTET